MAVEGELLLSAIERGDEEYVRTSLCRLLDAGDAQALDSAVEQAARAMGPAAWMLHTTLAEEAQQGLDGDVRVGLFCIPVLLDTQNMTAPPLAAVSSVLSTMAVGGEIYSLAGDWVHPSDLQSMTASTLHRMARSMGRTTQHAARPGDNRVVELPHADFEASHQDKVAASAMRNQCSLCIRGQDRTGVSNLGVRYILGSLCNPEHGPIPGAGQGGGGLFASIVDDSFDADCFEKLCTAIEVVMGPGVSVLTPALPTQACADAQGIIETMALQAHLLYALAQTGSQPLCHYCVHGDEVHVVLTRQDTSPLDYMVLKAVGSATDLVVDALFSHGRGVIAYETLDELPVVPMPTYH